MPHALVDLKKVTNFVDQALEAAIIPVKSQVRPRHGVIRRHQLLRQSDVMNEAVLSSETQYKRKSRRAMPRAGGSVVGILAAVV